MLSVKQSRTERTTKIKATRAPMRAKLTESRQKQAARLGWVWDGVRCIDV